MRIWAISDGRAGHYNQTKAIVKAFESIDSVSLEWLEVKLKIGGFRILLKTLLNYYQEPLPLWFLSLFYKLPSLPVDSPDCIVSTGGKTLYINALLARRFGCKNVFSGSLRGLKENHFTAFITLVSNSESKNNIVLDHAPTLIDTSVISAVGKAFVEEKKLKKCNLWAIFIGGDRYGYNYNDCDWQGLASSLIELYETQRVHWLLTTSRRTDPRVEEKLKKLLPQQILAQAVWWNEKPQRCMPEFLGAAKRVFVTEDSMAMIADGIASEHPVYTLYPEHPAPEKTYQTALDQLVENRRITRLPLNSFSTKINRNPLDVPAEMQISVKEKLVTELKKYF